MVRVDDQTYSLMGVKDPGNDVQPAVVQGAEYTATHSVFTASAGTVMVTLDFFSPVSPANYLRQSLPFSYLTVSVSGTAGNSVQVFSSIDGRWTGESEGAVCEFNNAGSTAMFSLKVEDATLYAESSDMATWGEAIFASRPASSSKLSFASGNKALVMSQFVKVGRLAAGRQQCKSGDIVALSHDLGVVIGDQEVTFAIGYVREKAINYLGKAYTGYYRAEYPDTYKAVSYFLDDYLDALSESLILDRKLSTTAESVAGQKYADIVTLSTRQAYGGIDLTIPDDTLDSSETLAFIKELSSDGNVNTVDVIMPAFPIYWVMDPDYIRLLLEPMMKYLSAGRWHKPYVIHDMGSHYPNAIGHDDQQAEPMPIEECGNLMVLILAYVRATGDEAWAAQYFNILKGYADYLVQNGIDIAEQLSSNDAAGPLANETNLAIKAAVGLKAFGELTGLTEYSSIADSRADLLFAQGLGTDEQKTHFVLQYPDKPSSWKIPYNLYPDVLLGLGTFPREVHQMSSAFFKSVRGEYGVPLDSRQDWAKSDWNMWLAGTLDNSTCSEFVNDLWAFVTNGKHDWPFSDRYIATSAKGNTPGVPVLCRARPTVGGHFALLALQGPGSLRVRLPKQEESSSLGAQGSQQVLGEERQEL
ncbi:hypothetical protein KXW39_004810 [Aspergillus fumigatus]|nr:hypothetical protein KXX17_003698 [Aspergillus fumigatus]KAH1920671.1 hypothetical protein KXW69_003499 [Aspergillus fumigatus]KAH1961588.1 hypothetical protein KXV90_005120 [Aspergillus fumigatus]KAH2247703.1 hypothetical protein KXW14_005366 [Aspergillus fumigatus]KAH2390445.1 hypothetical protein KXV62_002839 [Aspergillus fumigatus]